MSVSKSSKRSAKRTGRRCRGREIRQRREGKGDVRTDWIGIFCFSANLAAALDYVGVFV